MELPESRSLRADHKYFYFDPGHNERGDYLKISEVRPTMNGRQSITVSMQTLPQFLEILTDFQTKLGELRGEAEEAQT